MIRRFLVVKTTGESGMECEDTTRRGAVSLSRGGREHVGQQWTVGELPEWTDDVRRCGPEARREEPSGD
jgi:hypothetical protein